jgi:predicted alpha-1,6-mannanase (GH76 family)
MANTVMKRGFVPVGTVSGSPYSGAARVYSVAAANATAIYVGDLVTAATTSQTVNGTIMQDVVQGATGDVFQGVVVGVLPDVATSTPYRAASTLRRLLVCDDPNVLFEAEDVATGTPLAAADVGLNCNVVVGTGSTVTGYSGMELDNTTEATTNTLDLKIIAVPNRADNDLASASAKFLVRINRHRMANQTAGI